MKGEHCSFLSRDLTLSDLGLKSFSVLTLNCEEKKKNSLRPSIRFLQVKNSGGLGQQGAEEVKRGDQILDRYFVDRFTDRLGMMYEIKRRVKNDPKSFNLDLTETEREGCR